MFSRGLRKLRSDRGITQVELAKKVEVTQAAISRYEDGSALPSLDVAERIADTLRCSVDALLEREPERRVS